jgi:RNA polymerase sigma-70 factor (ECF subfamily)
VLDAVVAAADVRIATMLVLERLSPDQRVALVLHDTVGLGFGEVADVLGVTEQAARQMALRARRRVRDAAEAGELPAPAPEPEQRRVLEAFVAALAAADVPALVAVLHPEAAMHTDGGGVVRAARRVVRGADKIARFLVAVAQDAGPEALAGARPAMVNGEVGLLVPSSPAPVVVALTVDGGRATGVHLVLNPEKVPT